jgi:hypothetical protein
MRIYTNRLIDYASVAYLECASARTNQFYAGSPTFEDLNLDEKTLFREMQLLRELRDLRRKVSQYFIYGIKF